MKVILLQDVAKIGKKHAVVDVPDGYGLNQLIPRKMAKPATPENLKAALHEADIKKTSAASSLEKYEKTKAALNGKVISIPAPNKNQQGHLFAAIQKGQVIEALAKAGVVADPAMVELPRAIKESGEHEINLKHGAHHSSFIIKVE